MLFLKSAALLSSPVVQYFAVNSREEKTKILFDASTAYDGAASALMRALWFSNPPQNPATTARTLEITLNDGMLDSDPATITAHVTAAANSPSTTSGGGGCFISTSIR
jgi:hypothetical protein